MRRIKITQKWIDRWSPCQDGLDFVFGSGGHKIGDYGIDIVNTLIAADRLSDALWLIVRIMTRKQRILLSCYAARLSLPEWEKYSDSREPHNAIDAAEKFSSNDTAKNRSAAMSAAWSAVRNAAMSSVRSAARNAAWSAESAAMKQVLERGVQMMDGAGEG